MKLKHAVNICRMAIGNMNWLVKLNWNQFDLAIDVMKTCVENDVALIVSKTRSVEYAEGMESNGYFCDETKCLAFAIGGLSVDDWFRTFVHESCHMDQWLEQSSYWPTTEVEVDQWLAGDIEYTPEEIDKAFTELMLCEADCERRTILKLRQYKIHNMTELATYAQKANSYILFYNFMKKHRQWYEIGREPYNMPEIYNEMPSIIARPLERYAYPGMVDRFMPLYEKVYLNVSNTEQQSTV